MGKERIKSLLGCDRHSPVEEEVRRRLTWRMILLAALPVPFLLLLLFFLCCYVRINHELDRELIESLQRQNGAMEERLRLVEQSLKTGRDANWVER